MEHCFLLRTTFLLLGIFSSFLVSSQVFIGTLTNFEYEPLKGVILEDTIHHNQTFTDQYGKAQLSVKKGSLIKVSLIGYQTQFISINSQEDTVRHFIQLKEITKNLVDLNITNKRTESIAVHKNVNVLDYIPYNDFTLVLKSLGKEKFLSLENGQTTIQEFSLKKLNAKNLFEDCFGNIHILTQDSSFQIWMDSALNLFAPMAFEDFEKKIKPCIAHFGETTAFQSFTQHKKKYHLISLQKGETTPKTVCSIWDENAEKVASQAYWEIIAYYNQYAPEGANIISNGAWNGNLIALQLPGDSYLNVMISWYLKIRGREIQVSTFQVRDRLVTVDCLSDSIHVFNSSGTLINSTTFEKPYDKKTTILLDKMTGNLYAINDQYGSHKMALINTKDGTRQETETLEKIPLADNIQVYDNWLYYIKNQGGFHKLYRVQLKT